MAIKVKELKDDVIIDVKVNKTYYVMVKSVLIYLATTMTAENKDAYIKEAVTKEYKDLDDAQRAFYTISLLVAEIEKVATDTKQIEEKEILEPGDEGYVAPKLD